MTNTRSIIHLIILVTLCLTAYSCALNEQPAHAGEVSHGM